MRKLEPVSAPEAPPLKVKEFAQRLAIPVSTAHKLVAHEPGVLRILTPGSTKPVIRIPVAVVERIERRSAIKAI